MRSYKLAKFAAVLLMMGVISGDANADLIGHWTFDSGFNDSSGNGLNGTGLNGATAGVVDASRATGVLQLDGVNDYVAVADSSLLDLGGQFTITSWFKTNAPSASGAQHILRKLGDSGSPNEIYFARIQPGGVPLRFNVTGAGDVGVDANATQTFDSSAWYFMAATFDAQSNQQQLFLNDVSSPADTASALINAPVATTGELRIGRGDPGGYFNGRLDDLRIYDSALSSADLQIVADGGDVVDMTEMIIPGDFNGDELVDLLDLDTIQQDFGTLFVWGDIEVWQLHYQGELNQSARAFIASFTAVPEPSPAFLLIIFCGVIVYKRKRRIEELSSRDRISSVRVVKNVLPAKPSLILVALAAMVLIGSFSAPAFAQPEKPNIVFIVSDDHYFDDYSYTGANDFVQTPNIDQLAHEGLLFNRGYVPMSLCRTSLVTLLTGLYGVQHGVYGNDPNTRRSPGSGYPNSIGNQMMRRNIQHEHTLPKLLAEVGYVSQQTGKLWEGNFRRSGFTEGFVTDNNRHQDTIAIGRPGSGQSSDVSEVTDFIDQSVAANDPFFVFYAPLLPHTPHNAPGTYRDRYDPFVSSGEITNAQAEYFAQVDALDDSIGRIRSHIQGKTDSGGGSVDDNTIYVYAADNGWEQNPNRVGGEIGNRGKREPDESGIRTPIIISWKDQIFDARDIAVKLQDNSLASTIDLATTLLAAAGVTPPAKMEGVNLVTEERKQVFGDIYDHDQIVNTQASGDGLARVGNPEANLRFRWLVEGDWKLVVPASGSPELYNLSSDPLGLTDLAGQSANSQRVAAMSQEINDWFAINRPTTIYDHEFNGGATSIDGLSPEMTDASVSENDWSVGPQSVLNNGQINGRTTAVLPFTPEENKRYELRTGLSPVATNNSLTWLSFGFQEGVQTSIDPAEFGVAYARIRDDASLDDLVMHAMADGTTGWEGSDVFSTDDVEYFGGIATMMLVLDTGDNDSTIAGNQWMIALMVNGTSVYDFVFTQGNPDIGGIALGSYALPGDPTLAGTIDYLQLTEVQTSTYPVESLNTDPDPNPPTIVNSTPSDDPGPTVSAVDLLQTSLAPGEGTVGNNEDSIKPEAGGDIVPDARTGQGIYASWLGNDGNNLSSGGAVSLTGHRTATGLSNAATLSDGVWNNEAATSRGSAVFQSGEFIEYTFDLSTATLGYDITGIDLYSNWGSGDGRNEIETEITYSLVATPTVFDQVLITPATYDPVSTGDTTGTQGIMSITDLTATGVAGIRFDFPTQENNGVGYSEIDVFGSATTSTVVLLGDVNLDGEVSFSDITPFIDALSNGSNQAEADCDENGEVNFSDISPFIAILSGS